MTQRLISFPSFLFSLYCIWKFTVGEVSRSGSGKHTREGIFIYLSLTPVWSHRQTLCVTNWTHTGLLLFRAKPGWTKTSDPSSQHSSIFITFVTIGIESRIPQRQTYISSQVLCLNFIRTMASRFFSCSVPDCDRPSVRAKGGCDNCNRHLCLTHLSPSLHTCDEVPSLSFITRQPVLQPFKIQC